MTVRYYSSADSGAPVLNGNNGSLIALLDACLVNGYGSVAITSITQAAGVATVTTTAPHGYGSVPKTRLLIAGATPAAYNGEFDCTITGLNTFTYVVPGGTASPATGTITAKKNHCSWTKAFSATNQAAYQMPVGSNGHYLLVNDAGTANVATLKGCEVAYDASTGLNYFPAPSQQGGNGNLWMFKSSTANSTARPWILICNGNLFHLLVDNSSDSSTGGGISFGQINSYSSGDAYATILTGYTAAANTAQNINTIVGNLQTTQLGSYLARSYTQIGSSISCCRISDSARSGSSTLTGSGTLPYPHAPDGALSLGAIWCGEQVPPSFSTVLCVRGLVPGIWSSNQTRPNGHLEYVTGTAGDLLNKIFVAHNVYNTGQIHLEVSDTW